MSDNVRSDVCDEPELIPYLDIPTELWTDVFKLLPRCILVLQVQPVNKVFKAICDKNVKSIHIIANAQHFLLNSSQNFAKVKKDLAGHNCTLAEQFRMKYFLIFLIKKKFLHSIMRRCLDLFQGCQIETFPVSDEQDTTRLLAYFTLLEVAKPVYISFDLELNEDMEVNLARHLHHPTVLSCTRLKIEEENQAWKSRESILDWLHHRNGSNEEDMDMESSSVELPELRCLILSSRSEEKAVEQFIRWLLASCVQNLEGSRVPSGHFLFTFDCYWPLVDELETFGRMENPATGEVLLLERVMGEDGEPSYDYRLLRCLASQVANGTGELYAKVFKPDGEFNIGEDGQGTMKPPKVSIH